MAIFDTSFIIDILRNREEALTLRKTLDNSETEYFVSSPTIMELWEGALLSRSPKNEKEKINDMLSSLNILPLDAESAKRAAEISRTLLDKGEIIELEDVMIAGIAMENGEMVVTSDTHFTRIPGLKVLKY